MTRNELIEEVIARILAEPKQFDMRDWVTKSFCGTTACFAGHVCMVAHGLTMEQLLGTSCNQIVDISTKALGIPYREAEDLYFTSNWPDEWYRRLNKFHPGSPEYAQVVADYARKFFALPEVPNPAEVKEEALV